MDYICSCFWDTGITRCTLAEISNFVFFFFQSPCFEDVLLQEHECCSLCRSATPIFLWLHFQADLTSVQVSRAVCKKLLTSFRLFAGGWLGWRERPISYARPWSGWGGRNGGKQIIAGHGVGHLVPELHHEHVWELDPSPDLISKYIACCAFSRAPFPLPMRQECSRRASCFLSEASILWPRLSFEMVENPQIAVSLAQLSIHMKHPLSSRCLVGGISLFLFCYSPQRLNCIDLSSVSIYLTIKNKVRWGRRIGSEPQQSPRWECLSRTYCVHEIDVSNGRVLFVSAWNTYILRCLHRDRIMAKLPRVRM